MTVLRTLHGAIRQGAFAVRPVRGLAAAAGASHLFPFLASLASLPSLPSLASLSSFRLALNLDVSPSLLSHHVATRRACVPVCSRARPCACFAQLGQS